MTQLLHQWSWLLAASSNGHVLARFDHKRSTYDSGEILTVLTLVALLVTVILLLVRVRSNFQTESKRGLFSELCRAHGLNSSSRRLLRLLAVARELKNPATLFVEPSHFASNNLPHALRHAGKDLQRLRERLFG
jgi:hypothetical protein